VALHRDVIFAATADEEIDSDVGADWLVTHHPDLVRAEYGLSEAAATRFIWKAGSSTLSCARRKARAG
jgi:acetylornithine deacetylase/succinyl-diaminopimelate desuccinylase-like protein